MPTSRVCTKCHVEKPFVEFSNAPRGKYGIKSSCKECDARRHKAQYEPHPRLGPRRPPLVATESKACRKCGVVKTIGDFSLSRKATATQNAVYRSYCKACSSEQAMQWYRDNPGRTIANKRKFNLATLYGITLQQYEDMLRAQGGVCAICGSAPTMARKTQHGGRLTVDHCHDKGHVRGLLCHRCNRALGLLGDDPVILRKAISYLLRTKEGAVRQGGQ